MRSPFIFHEGRWYLIPTFNRRPTARLLRTFFDALLDHHPPKDILILRPMKPSEVKLLMQYRSDFDAEAFALMAPNEDKRIG